jgi:hypothetical protein
MPLEDPGKALDVLPGPRGRRRTGGKLVSVSALGIRQSIHGSLNGAPPCSFPKRHGTCNVCGAIEVLSAAVHEKELQLGKGQTRCFAGWARIEGQRRQGKERRPPVQSMQATLGPCGKQWIHSGPAPRTFGGVCLSPRSQSSG